MTEVEHAGLLTAFDDILVALHHQLTAGGGLLDLSFAAFSRLPLVQFFKVDASDLMHLWPNHLRAYLFGCAIEHDKRAVQVLTVLPWQLSQR